MADQTLIQEALQGAAANAQRAFDALSDPALTKVPIAEKTAWAMAAMIHCDVCRLVAALGECQPTGLVRLLWMAEISSKLYEAKEWYFTTGARLLLAIASNKPFGPEPVKARLKSLKAQHPISAIDRFAKYRNKLGYHYDSDALEFVRRLGAESAEDYFSILSTFVRYSGGWADLSKQVIRGQLLGQDGKVAT